MILKSLKELEHCAYTKGDRELSSKLSEIIDNFSYLSEIEYTRGFNDGWCEGASSHESGWYDTGYETAIKDVSVNLLKHLNDNDVSERVVKLVKEFL